MSAEGGRQERGISVTLTHIQLVNDEDLAKESVNGPEQAALRIVNLSKEYNRYSDGDVQRRKT